MGLNAIRYDGLYAKSLREYGALVGKINHCVEDINTLGHKIEKAEERRHMAEFDMFPDLEKYDHTIKMLTEARSCLKKELSGYEERALELQQVFYDGTNPGTGIPMDHDAAHIGVLCMQKQKNVSYGNPKVYAENVAERDFAELIVTEKYSEPLE